MSQVSEIFLIHGWGLNAAIWDVFASDLMAQHPRFKVTQIDLPGYGSNSDCPSSSSLTAMAEHCLANAPQRALWVGWSLGGLVAMRATLMDTENRIQALQLINTTPKFTRAEDWDFGVDIDIFRAFCRKLADDYERSLSQFLLLQAGSGRGVRKLARKAHAAICRSPKPAKRTLFDGIECLATSDIRSELASISVPVQVVRGMQDRIIDPQCSGFLAEALGAPLVDIQCGHAPFVSNPVETRHALVSFIDSLYAGRSALCR